MKAKPIRNIALSLCLLLACVTFPACQSTLRVSPKRITAMDVMAANLTNGKTTKAYCLSKFGPPSETDPFDKNSLECLKWKCADGPKVIALFGRNQVLDEHLFGYLRGKTFVNLYRVQPAVHTN